MTLQKPQNGSRSRTAAKRDGRLVADPASRISPSSSKTVKRSPRGLGLRVIGIGALLILPLGVAVSLMLPRGDAEVPPPPPAVRDAFAARWPADDRAPQRETRQAAKAAQPEMRPIAANPGPQPRDRQPRPPNTLSGSPEAAFAATNDLAAGVVGNGLAWNAYALGTPRVPPNDTAPRFQAANARPNEARFQSPTKPPDTGALVQPKTELVEFGTAPFPYEGVMPGTDQPFLNVMNNGQKGHRTSRGSVLWEEETFSDSRVLLHIPSGFNINNPAVMVVFFHGHGANLSRDVMNRQKLPEQISVSGMNAVLVAPQFAVNAANSSPGRFWQPGGFGRFIDEAGKKLAGIYGNPAKAKQFANMPVILVAYSGGYLPASWSIRAGGIGPRLRGVVLLDALYGEIDNFAKWIKNSPSVFFISAYTSSTRRQNLELAQILSDENVPYSNEVGRNLWRGRVAILPSTSDANHRDFVTHAWTNNPIADILAKLN